MEHSIGFIVLHYNAIKETIDCVESIKKRIDTDKCYIVVVDNASPNHTGEELERKYHTDDKVVVLKLTSNLGFAKGNNEGYRYAVENLKCDFICALNNDTLLMQDDFFSVIQKEYKKSQFGILGPKILLNAGKVQPVYYHFPNVEYFEEELAIHKKDYWLMRYRLNYIVVPCRLIRNYLYKKIGKQKESRSSYIQSLKYVDKRMENVVLHGCCLVFSPLYLSEYEEGFHPDTFLYKEEELLYLRCKRKKLKTVYNPELKIRHLEDVSTNSTTMRRRKKIMFWLRNQIDSLEILIRELKKEQK